MSEEIISDGLFEAEIVQPELQGNYDESSIQELAWNVHIRRRPGMYIGKLGDGSASDDGIYVLLKEVIDNSIDEFKMGGGRKIEISVAETGEVTVRDYGRGIPLGSVRTAVSVLMAGGKFDDKAFKKSVGLNGVGLKAVNALSSNFEVISHRGGQKVRVSFERGELIEEDAAEPTREADGTLVRFTPDNDLFKGFSYRMDIVEAMMRNYSYLNTGLTLSLNGRNFLSRHGLADLLEAKLKSPDDALYPPIHLKGEDIEIVLTHTPEYGEEYFSFVNGQHTIQGGTHLSAFREHASRTIKEFFKKNYEYSDIRNGMVAAVSVQIQEPQFESQTKIKLSSKEVAPDSPLTVNKFVGDFIKRELDNYLHRNPESAEEMEKKIKASEKERKSMAGLTKLARERAKKVSLHNRKLRDCRIHFNDTLKPSAKEDRRDQSSIFITEGDSASGTITKVRNAETQAVFSLRGKPLNTFGLTPDIVYKNEEFSLLSSALNLEAGIDELRYNKIIIATDADVDGMHIRLLTLTFFLMFFPEVVREGHVYILQTPLFRVRNKKVGKKPKHERHAVDKSGERQTYYCYSDEEREQAIAKLGEQNAEITRFKGLGEIDDKEFAEFIGPEMRLDPVILRDEDTLEDLLTFYMGKNTMERQHFIIDNLIVEDDSQIA